MTFVVPRERRIGGREIGAIRDHLRLVPG
jgi:hypothetical protein